MQLKLIRYAITVAQFGNFTKAAEYLYISQPALSQAIRRLENDLEIEIFNRERNQVTLTPAGKILVQEGEKLLEIEDRLHQQLEVFRRQENHTLTVGAAPSYQKYYLSGLLSTFKSLYPQTKIDLRDGFSRGLCEDILNGQVDIGLVCEPIPAGLYFFPIFREEIFLALPRDHRLVSCFPAEGEPYPVADFSLCRDEEFISYRPGRRIVDILFTEAKRAGFTPKILTVCSSTESANTMVFHGMGISIIPSSAVELSPPDQRAAYYRLRPGGVFRWFGLARRDEKCTSRAQEAFFSVAKALRDAKISERKG